MIRFIFIALFLVIFLIISLPIQLVLWIIKKITKNETADYASLRIVQWAFKVLIFICGTKVNVIGEENVPADQAVMYVGNHCSYFDIVLTYVRMKRLTGYIAKKEMLRYPSLRIWMMFLHCLFLDRTDMKAGMKMIIDAINMIKGGISVFIFPEGTRNRTGDELAIAPFKEGSFKIADKAGCLIVPVAITGAADIFENHIPFIRKANVTIQYGKPIDPKALDSETKKHIGVYAQDIIVTMIKEHKGIS